MQRRCPLLSRSFLPVALAGILLAAPLSAAPGLPLPPAADRLVMTPEHPYAAALRFLEPRLTPAAAITLATAVKARSADAGVDPRLVVAVMGVEGTLTRVRQTRAGVRIGDRPARAAVGRMADELASRLRSHCDDGLPFSEALRRTLADRAANRCGQPSYWPHPQRYMRDVLRLHAHLCGDDPPSTEPARQP